MGFCRRCGDIVVGPRCKCGGTAWDQNEGRPQDRWSKTYVTREKSPTRPVRETVEDTPPSAPSGSSRRFPRPASSVTLGSAESPPSSSAAAAAGILPNPNGSELAKVYGSVLQPKETLDSFHCALCSTPFSPDATIYPDPSTLSLTGVVLTPGNNTRFLCRPCFVDNGGSKGDCPACHRPVLILKTEGGFVENSGRVWHKKCFLCDGCGKDIGKPCCADCFDSCLNRSTRNTPQKSGRKDDGTLSNLGGTRRGEREREGSPALEELEQRLGIIRSRENTPVKDDRSIRTNSGLKSPTLTPVRSPLASRYAPGNTGSVDSSPIVERLAARARADSFPSLGSSPAMQIGASARDGSPLSARRMSRYRSPDPEDALSDGSPAPRRTYNRFRSPEPDVFGSSPISRITGSPRYGSPSATSKQPTEEAIEEMKKRFLGQASPAPATSSSSTKKASAETMTARRRSRSRTRSSIADESGVLRPSFTGMSTTGEGRETVSRIPRKSETPSSRSSPSTSSVQISVRQDKTGETDYTLRRDRTGDDEVESLLGEKVPTGNLIDISTDHLQETESTGPMSDISMHGLRTGLGIRTTSSRTDLSTEYDQSVPSTPDLAGEFSDTTPPGRRTSTTSTGSGTRRLRTSDAFSSNTPTPKSKTLPSGISLSSPTPLSSDARCARCNLPLFTTKFGGKFVTVPEEPASSGVPPKTYHTACFRCKVCDGPFEEREGGRTVFVRGEDGACHVEVPDGTAIVSIPKPSISTYSTREPTSSRYERPPPSAPATSTTFTRVVPWVQHLGSPMERGVVPGPQGTRWHGTCLLKEEGRPGCGKKLDSAAKTDIDGRVWCRECLLLLPASMRNPTSPVRSPVAPQHTGTTTLARTAMMRQLTGGGLSPTRQLSTDVPPPKSVTGIRSTKSDGEGRGMFLVRQLTGGK
ncbi:uncharacterized protein B0H18DRAFT_1081709 [Fomitopsis serialis]|uniref:uncharacterized protein n=1 Tax=Fomitopsis serialis TaxID=139415 RepID=UPI00200812E7|nr:uncharacterized protein B0H18DRAFT_1081709 [Neoantrodia serialis]KAH9937560.1 hypothetical protein B0H18DRAFT_1081709 [Neoantrodia serialis]